MLSMCLYRTRRLLFLYAPIVAQRSGTIEIMKLLDGSELAAYIQERQAKQVRHLRQSLHCNPTLVILKTSNDDVIETYVRMKKRYGSEIGVSVVVEHVSDNELPDVIDKYNQDDETHAIIIQLPLADQSMTDQAVGMVDASKDVDGLSGHTSFTPATAMAIDWLLNGYNIEMRDKKIAIVGSGRLVGGPLAKMWTEAGYNVTSFDENSKNMIGQLKRYNLIVSAAGVPGLINSHSVQPGAVVVDAATSSEHGKILGDVADDVRERSDLTITPEKGGVGPLTVCALFDNVLRAAYKKATN